MVTLGRRLLPDRPLEDRLHRARLPSQLIDLYRLPERIFTLHVPPNSPIVGQTLAENGLGRDHGLTVLALWRGGEPVERRISEESLRLGDAFLVQGPWHKIRLLRDQPGLPVISE